MQEMQVITGENTSTIVSENQIQRVNTNNSLEITEQAKEMGRSEKEISESQLK